MKKRQLVLKALMLCFCVASFAQTSEDIVMTIHDKKITKGEFEYIFNKNNTDSTVNESIKDYVDLFVKFKLKVIEAEQRGMDKDSAFIKELDGYREQLAKPYLIDKELDDSIMQRTYYRLSHEVKASHILLKADFDNPEDTLKVYNEIMDLRKRILNGEDFNTLAKQYSEDPSAKTNGGDLGYFGGFMMVYPFEQAAFTTKVGKVSNPVKTRFGYHILKVFDKRASRGEVKAAHILWLNQNAKTAEAKAKLKKQAEKVYGEIMSGFITFEEAAEKYSNDTQSAKEGGVLPWFGNGMMVPEFQEVAFGLKEKGEVSNVFESRFGYHIIKLIDKRAFPSFSQKEEEIRKRLQRSSLGKLPDEVFIKKRKAEYNYTKFDDNVAEFVGLSEKYNYRDSMFKVVTRNMDKPVFTLNDVAFTQRDFADYLIANPRSETPDEQKRVNLKYDRWHIEAIRGYEKSILEEKYPDFRYLMQEYHDGILLFEISSKEVWDKASTDEEGLKKFHKKNNKNYRWAEEVYRGKIYYTLNDSVENIVKQKVEDKIADSLILREVNKYKPLVSIEEGFYTEGKNNAVDALCFKTKELEPHNLFNNAFIKGKKYKKKTKRTYEETQKGKLISDYQNYLEQKWIKSLKKKYKIKVDKKVLKTVSIN